MFTLRSLSRFDTAVSLTVITLLLALALMIGSAGRPQPAAATPQILYLAWHEGSNGDQIFVTTPDGRPPTQLTRETGMVLDFAPSPNGQTIIYSARRDDGGSDLWAIDRQGNGRRQLLACPDGACSQPVWMPDGRRLLYERRSFLAPGSPPGPPRLWWLDTIDGATLPVFADTQWLGYRAIVAPSGQWISYLSPVQQEIHAYHLSSGRLVRIPSRSGEPAAWNSRGDELLITQIRLDAATLSTDIIHIALGDAPDNDAPLDTDAMRSLSGATAVQDSWPAWSPDDQWIAFTRKGTAAQSNKQLWLMRAGGRDARPLTAEETVHHGPPQWSADGRFLLYQRLDIGQQTGTAVWLFDVVTGEAAAITTGSQPAWLP